MTFTLTMHIIGNESTNPNVHSVLRWGEKGSGQKTPKTIGEEESS